MNRVELHLDSDLIIFSRDRWTNASTRMRNWVQHQIKVRRVYFVEMPLEVSDKARAPASSEDAQDSSSQTPSLQVIEEAQNFSTIVLHHSRGLEPQRVHTHMASLLEEVILEDQIRNYTFWYHTPDAIAFSRHLSPSLVIYDRLEEEMEMLSLLNSEAAHLEEKLLESADAVFTTAHLRSVTSRPRNATLFIFPDTPEAERKRMLQSVSAESTDTPLHDPQAEQRQWASIHEQVMTVERRLRASLMRPLPAQHQAHLQGTDQIIDDTLPSHRVQAALLQGS